MSKICNVWENSLHSRRLQIFDTQSSLSLYKVVVDYLSNKKWQVVLYCVINLLSVIDQLNLSLSRDDTTGIAKYNMASKFLFLF